MFHAPSPRASSFNPEAVLHEHFKTAVVVIVVVAVVIVAAAVVVVVVAVKRFCC